MHIRAIEAPLLFAFEDFQNLVYGAENGLVIQAQFEGKLASRDEGVEQCFFASSVRRTRFQLHLRRG